MGDIARRAPGEARDDAGRPPASRRDLRPRAPSCNISGVGGVFASRRGMRRAPGRGVVARLALTVFLACITAANSSRHHDTSVRGAHAAEGGSARRHRHRSSGTPTADFAMSAIVEDDDAPVRPRRVPVEARLGEIDVERFARRAREIERAAFDEPPGDDVDVGILGLDDDPDVPEKDAEEASRDATRRNTATKNAEHAEVRRTMTTPPPRLWRRPRRPPWQTRTPPSPPSTRMCDDSTPIFRNSPSTPTPHPRGDETRKKRRRPRRSTKSKSARRWRRCAATRSDDEKPTRRRRDAGRRGREATTRIRLVRRRRVVHRIDGRADTSSDASRAATAAGRGRGVRWFPPGGGWRDGGRRRNRKRDGTGGN